MLAQAIRKKLGKAGKEEKGFTLIELLAVIVILGIIAVIAIPMIGNLITSTKGKSDVATARQVYDAARLYVTTELNGSVTAPVSVIGNSTSPGLQSKGYLEKDIVLPSNKKTITAGVVNYNASGELTDVAADSAAGTPAYAISLTTSAGVKYFTKNEIITAEPSTAP